VVARTMQRQQRQQARRAPPEAARRLWYLAEPEGGEHRCGDGVPQPLDRRPEDRGPPFPGLQTLAQGLVPTVVLEDGQEFASAVAHLVRRQAGQWDHVEVRRGNDQGVAVPTAHVDYDYWSAHGGFAKGVQRRRAQEILESAELPDLRDQVIPFPGERYALIARPDQAVVRAWVHGRGSFAADRGLIVTETLYDRVSHSSVGEEVIESMCHDSPGPHDLGRVPVYLVESAKSWDTAPRETLLGEIRLGRWRLERLSPVPPDLEGQVPYLVRVHYDFKLEDGASSVAAAQVRFGFEPDVVVADARPDRVSERQGPVSFRLTSQLNFVARDGGVNVWPTGSPAADIPLSTLVPDIVVSGVSHDFIEWRHSGEVLPGGNTGLLVLLVPESWETLKVVAEGNYEVRLGPDLRTVARKDAFTVRLPPAEAAGAPAAPIPSADLAATRVFVSYAQESDGHKADVAALCSLLARKGLRADYDQQGGDVRRNWDEWTNTEFDEADYVIVVASPAYQAAGAGKLPKGKHLGVRSEYRRLADLLHGDPEKWTRKILPVVLPGRSPEEIPLSFGPRTCDYYEVEAFTDQGAEALLRVLLSERALVPRRGHELSSL
jgi:TIR domain